MSPILTSASCSQNRIKYRPDSSPLGYFLSKRDYTNSDAMLDPSGSLHSEQAVGGAVGFVLEFGDGQLAEFDIGG